MSVNTTEILNDEIKPPYQAYPADLPLSFLFLFIIFIIILYYIFYLWQSSKLSRVSGTGALCDTHDEFTNSRLAVYVFQFAAFIFGYCNAITFFISNIILIYYIYIYKYILCEPENNPKIYCL